MSRVLIIPFLVAFHLASVTAVPAQTGSVVSQYVVRQPHGEIRPQALASQPTNSNSPAISPQRIDGSQEGRAVEIPQANRYAPSETSKDASRNFVNQADDDRITKKLGVTVVEGKHAYYEVAASYCHASKLSHRAPESFGPVRVLIRGLEVVSVEPGSAADLAGLRGRIASDRPSNNQFVSWLLPDRSVGTGDLIIAVDGWPASNEEVLDRVMRHTASGGSVLLSVLSPGRDREEPTERSVPVKLQSDPMLAQHNP